MKVMLPLFPAMAAFGPLLMVMGSERPGSLIWLRYVGALMTTLSLFTIFWLVATQAKEMQRTIGSSTSGVDASPDQPMQVDRDARTD